MYLADARAPCAVATPLECTAQKHTQIANGPIFDFEETKMLQRGYGNEGRYAVKYRKAKEESVSRHGVEEMASDVKVISDVLCPASEHVRDDALRRGRERPHHALQARGHVVIAGGLHPHDVVGDDLPGGDELRRLDERAEFDRLTAVLLLQVALHARVVDASGEAGDMNAQRQQVLRQLRRRYHVPRTWQRDHHHVTPLHRHPLDHDHHDEIKV